MKKIGFSGTLDPITNGHMWVINEARSLADEVVVFLSENPAKKPKFSAEERKSIISLSCAEQGWDNVSSGDCASGDYTARAAKKQGVELPNPRHPHHGRFRLRESDPANQRRRAARRKDGVCDAAARPWAR